MVSRLDALRGEADRVARERDAVVVPRGEGAAAALVEWRRLNARLSELDGEIVRLEKGQSKAERRLEVRGHERDFEDQYAEFATRQRLVGLGVLRPNVESLGAMLDNRPG